MSGAGDYVRRPHASTSLRVLVDGVIFRAQSHGGISRIFHEILPRMCQVEPNLAIELLMDGPARQELPAHSHIRVRSVPCLVRVLRPGRLWRPFLPSLTRGALRLWLGPQQGAIWHSTYYTLPDRKDRPTVITVYDMIYERFPHLFSDAPSQVFRDQKRQSVLGADVVVCISQSTSCDVQAYYGLDPSRIRVVPLAGSNQFASYAEAMPRPGNGDSPFLLYVGSRHRYKNYAGLLRAFALWPRHKHFQLLTVGLPWSEDERTLISSLGLTGRVQLLEGVDDSCLCRLYNRASVFVYPSLYEGFGIPLLEAMACGCPVVASRIPSSEEVASDYPFYFDTDSTDSFVYALDCAVNEGHEPSRVALGLSIASGYTWQQTAEKTLAVYRELSV